MFLFISKPQTIVFTLFFSLALWGSAVSKDEERNMIYGYWKLPSQLGASRIQKLLNQFSQETYGKAFRYLGVEEDWFHGHVIFERKEVDGTPYLFPRAILYHTQEEAYKAHWDGTLDPKYDYLDVSTRNWIQWLDDDSRLDGTRIENAKKYLDVTQKDPSQFETEKAEPKKEWHYTIHAKNLDDKKLGFVGAGELQFEFRDASIAGSSSPNFYGSSPGPIEVKIPGGPTVHLNLSTQTTFIERGVFK